LLRSQAGIQTIKAPQPANTPPQKTDPRHNNRLFNRLFLKFFRRLLDQALESTAKEWIGTTKNRIDEECIRARDLGDMSREDYHKGIERNRETFASIKACELSGALASGNKRAFSQAAEKKAGVDEGPEE
jgi:hypothetical protein